MADLNGDWMVELKFVQGEALHAMKLVQEGDQLSGSYRSGYGEQAIRGQVQGNEVRWHVGIHYQHCGAHYSFSGTLDGDAMSGTLGLGEYWQAEWKAKRAG